MLLIHCFYCFHLMMSLSLSLSLPYLDDFESGTLVPPNVISDSKSDESSIGRAEQEPFMTMTCILHVYQVMEIALVYAVPLSCGEYSLALLFALLLVGRALSQTEYDTRPKVITPVSGTENGNHGTAHTETKTDPAYHSSTTTTPTTDKETTNSLLFVLLTSLLLLPLPPLLLLILHRLIVDPIFWFESMLITFVFLRP